ncbi:uncharacterized protein F4807DRAFT_444286 [Annulohypoxylon truncatum]|uniref:uncharacterized protein n=1 Tax=Annulohypoxylon truncatum TaxID=327061 RepID=UPI002007A017|nr:uncharacterized protein F4807DRAFT_444286 [Annulohypoxylon truncatum]KAI1205037.1 hypothetical protein F4807DRAFT_444286 [Annulohypoxylon truncatum]
MAQYNKNILHYDYQTRRRVWDSIYKRIDAPIGNPYRFAHISSHRHLRLDDQVRSFLSEDIKNRLPTNMDPCDYNSLPEEVQDGASNRSPRRPTTTTTSAIIPGPYANDDIIHSPTAQAATRPRSPISEVYHTPSQGHLRRPTKISNSPRRTQENKQSTKKPQTPTKPTTPKKTKSPKSPKTPKNKHTASKAKQVEESESSKSVNPTSTITNDSDWDEYANVASPHKEHCLLCHHYKQLNTMVADNRMNKARRLISRNNYENSLHLAARRVTDYQYILGLMEKTASVTQPIYDPADTRLWPQLAEHMAELLETRAKEEKEAMNKLLENFRRTTFVLVDRDNLYNEEDHINCPMCKELPLSGEQINVSGPMPYPAEVVLEKLTEEEREEYETWWRSLFPLSDESDESDVKDSLEESDEDKNKNTNNDMDEDMDDYMSEEEDDDWSCDVDSDIDLELFNNY